MRAILHRSKPSLCPARERLRVKWELHSKAGLKMCLINLQPAYSLLEKFFSVMLPNGIDLRKKKHDEHSCL